MIRNVWVILYKQKRYKVLPVLTNYVLCIVLASMRAVWSIWLLYAWDHMIIMLNLFPITVNSAISLNQVWIIAELCFVIRHSLATIESDPKSGKEVKSPSKLIKYGRIITASIISFSVVCMAIVFLVYEETHSRSERKDF